MNLKNYTSSVSAITTIGYIETYLADAGVLGISKQFDSQKRVCAVFFQVQAGDLKFTVRLPAKTDDVQEYLWRNYVSNHSSGRKLARTREAIKAAANARYQQKKSAV